MIGALSKVEPKLEALVSWAVGHGALFPGQRVAEIRRGYRGIVAEAPIEEGETLCWVPRSLILCCDKAAASKIGRRIRRKNIDLHSPQSLLAAFLLEETLKPDSFFRPYLKSLPRCFPENPVFFEEQQLKPLHGTYALHWIQSRKQYVQREYQALGDALPDFARRHDFHRFLWAMTAINSRAFEIPKREGRCEPALIPLLDLYNHSSKVDGEKSLAAAPEQGRTAQERVDACGVGLTAIRSIPRSHEIAMSYGIKAATRFFVNYGFVGPGSFEAQLHPAEGPLGVNGAWVVDDSDYAKVKGCLEHLRGALRLDSARVGFSVAEQVALQRLAWMARHSMRPFEEKWDLETALAKGGAAVRQADVLAVRRGERAVLQRVVRFAEQAFALMVLSPNERRAALEKAACGVSVPKPTDEWLSAWAKDALKQMTESAQPGKTPSAAGDVAIRVAPLTARLWPRLHRLELLPEQQKFVPRPVALLRHHTFSGATAIQVAAIFAGEDVAGVFCWRQNPDEWVDFFGFQVDRCFQGRGVGATTVDRFLKGLRCLPNVQGVRLNVHRQNTAVVAMYLRRGFKFAPSDDPNHWNMSLKIKPGPGS